jgi:small-conductance mechanosensitive channel
MTFIIDLWAPILLSAVIVFILSSLIHTALQYHKNDYRQLKDETPIQEALRGFNIPPGDYFLPYCAGGEAAKSEAYKEKIKKGPVMVMTVFPTGGFGMGQSLVLWFLYCVVVSLFAAYLAYHALDAATHYLQVFRIVGTATFMGYSLALLQGSIWFKKGWCATLKSVFDGLIYALVTAGVFGWLWPR